MQRRFGECDRWKVSREKSSEWIELSEGREDSVIAPCMKNIVKKECVALISNSVWKVNKKYI